MGLLDSGGYFGGCTCSARIGNYFDECMCSACMLQKATQYCAGFVRDGSYILPHYGGGTMDGVIVLGSFVKTAYTGVFCFFLLCRDPTCSVGYFLGWVVDILYIPVAICTRKNVRWILPVVLALAFRKTPEMCMSVLWTQGLRYMLCALSCVPS